MKNTIEINLGDLVIEKRKGSNPRRIGEVVFIREGRRRKLEMIQLNKHDLSPLSRGNMEGPKCFSLHENECKRLNLFKYEKRKEFKIGDFIKFTKRGRAKYGFIISFIHPDGLYSESYEKGYNGKDYLECIEVKPSQGLPRKKDSDGNPCLFLATPDRTKACELMPMDKDGGIRIFERDHRHAIRSQRPLVGKP